MEKQLVVVSKGRKDGTSVVPSPSHQSESPIGDDGGVHYSEFQE